MKNPELSSQDVSILEQINIENDIFISLSEAIDQDDLDLENFQILLNKLIDINAKDDDGWTLLHKAVDKHHFKAIEILIKKGVDVNAKDKYGWTPLHLAAFIGNIEISEILLANDADANVKNSEDSLPWQIAILGGHLKIAEKLIQLRTNNETKYEQDIAHVKMMIKSPYLIKDHYNVIKQLILSGIDFTQDLPVNNNYVNNLIAGICKDIKAIAKNNKVENLSGNYTNLEDVEFAAQLFVNFHKFDMIDYNSYAEIRQKIISCDSLYKPQNVSLKNALLNKLEKEQKTGIEFMAIVEGQVQHYLHEAESPVSKYLIQIDAIKNNKDLPEENKKNACDIIYQNIEDSLIKLLRSKEHNANHIAISITEATKDNLQKPNIIKSFKMDILNLRNHLVSSKNVLDALYNVIKKCYEYSENDLTEYSIKLRKDIRVTEQENQELKTQLAKNAKQTNELNKLVSSWNLTEEQKNELSELQQKFTTEPVVIANDQSGGAGLLGSAGNTDNKIDIYFSDH